MEQGQSVKITCMNILHRLLFELQYLSKPPWDSGIAPPELKKFTAEHIPGRALDLGCGTGTNAIYLAQRKWSVIGVDFAWQAVWQARRKAKNLDIEIEFRQSDVTQLAKISGPFELILDIGCFHSLSNMAKTRYLRNAARLLAPDGVFLLYAFINPKNEGLGLTASELEWMKSKLNLVSMEMGKDRGRPSAWMWWQLPPLRSASE